MKEIVYDMFYSHSHNNRICIYTGEKGLYNFETESIISGFSKTGSKDSLENAYRNLRDEYYNLGVEYRNSLIPWYIKLYRWTLNRFKQ